MSLVDSTATNSDVHSDCRMTDHDYDLLASGKAKKKNK